MIKLPVKPITKDGKVIATPKQILECLTSDDRFARLFEKGILVGEFRRTMVDAASKENFSIGRLCSVPLNVATHKVLDVELVGDDILLASIEFFRPSDQSFYTDNYNTLCLMPRVILGEDSYRIVTFDLDTDEQFITSTRDKIKDRLNL